MAADAGAPWYALVDAAADERLFALLRRSGKAECLFSGELAPEFAAAAPHLVAHDPREPLFEAWTREGGGRNWGLFCRSGLPFDALRRHFKKLLNVRLPDGNVVLFRFWDPRVFNPYVRACTDAERYALFGAVSDYLVEGEGGQRHAYSCPGGQLQIR